jgi:hypothetical protein
VSDEQTLDRKQLLLEEDHAPRVRCEEATTRLEELRCAVDLGRELDLARGLLLRMPKLSLPNAEALDRRPEGRPAASSTTALGGVGSRPRSASVT